MIEIKNISNIPGQISSNGKTAPSDPISGFKEMIKTSMNDLGELQKGADTAIKEMAAGKNGDVHEVMIAMEKAGISLKMMVQVRNKVMAAYEEIMRMQL